jgi:hypothetical protein
MQKILTLFLALGWDPLMADTVTFSVSPAAGQFFYQFILTNTGGTGGTLFDLFLALPTDISNIDTATIGTPVGWGDPTGGLLFFGPDVNPSTSFVEWAADFSGAYDVEISNSLLGFSFTTFQRIDNPIVFSLNASTSFSIAQELSTVPEPSTVGVLAATLSIVAGVHLRRFRTGSMTPPGDRGR